MKPIKKEMVVWLSRNAYYPDSFLSAWKNEPTKRKYSEQWEGMGYLGVFPCTLGMLGMKKGTKRKVKITVVVEDAD